MKNGYPVVTLCGSTRFKDEFMQAQKELTLKGMIVISVGLFGHSGDEEVWDGMDEGAISETKFMLDDMHKSKIDMADGIYVVNPGGYIGDSTWSEICYARMTKKDIRFLEPIDESLIDNKVHFHIKLAEMHAFRQFDVWSHARGDYPSDDYLLSQMSFIKKGKYTTIDPWVPEDESVPVVDYPFINHADKNSGYDPFEIYGTQKMARFVEEILLRNKMDRERVENSKTREEMMDEIEWYCRELDMPLPKGYPEQMSDSEMQKWIETWDEFDPCPDI